MRSHVVFTYIERDFIERGGTLHRVLARIGEPWVFGWDPPALPAWLDARGFALASDREDSDLADALLPPRVAAHVRG